MNAPQRFNHSRGQDDDNTIAKKLQEVDFNKAVRNQGPYVKVGRKKLAWYDGQIGDSDLFEREHVANKHADKEYLDAEGAVGKEGHGCVGEVGIAVAHCPYWRWE